jgi:hypothetical protein
MDDIDLENVKRRAEQEINEEDFKAKVIEEKQKIRAHKPKSFLRWLFSWV